MTTAIEYALMAGHAYLTTRDEINWLPVPQGWTPFFHVPDSTTPTFPATAGFEATSFIKGTEIVISFAGTYDKDVMGDVAADIALGTGLLSDQLFQAAEYYMQVKAANPTANITLTGHSLGGGLASLIAVFFNETAMTFDQAPFRNSASWMWATELRLDLANKFPESTYPQIADWLAPLDRFIWSFDPLGQGWSQDGLDAREAKVTNLCVQGEFLSVAPALRIGSELSPLTHGDYFGPLDLHSQALLTAFLQSGDTSTSTSSDHTLGQVTFKLTDLLKMIFDTNLFAHPTDPNSPDVNFLEHLVRHQTGGVDGVQAGGDAMVTRFTSDLWKLAQDGGLTMSDWALTGTGVPNNVSQALIAFAMQKYYEETDQSAGYNQELFTDLGTGGIRFDIAGISTRLLDEWNSTGTMQLDKMTEGKYDLKGYQYFEEYLGQTAPDQGAGAVQFTAAEQGIIKSILPILRDWYIQAGSGGMTATDILNRGAFMLGGNGADTLTGGTETDMLVGNAGADTLEGGQGNDILLGGTGADTYKYTTGDGFDVILDSDGDGNIKIDGTDIAGGAQFGDERVHRDSSGHLYVSAGAHLIIDGNMLVQNYQQGNLGLNMTGPAADTNPATTRDINGDLTPDGTGNLDDLGNLITNGIAAPDRADYLNDSAGNDHIAGGGGDDILYADKGGDDLIETGAGRDKAYGFGGKDVITGGADGDILWGGDDNDRLYADTQMSAAAAIAAGNIIGSGVNQQGDWLSGGAGDDTLIGSTANDVLMGGGGTDLIIGGAGNDDIMGDCEWVAASFDWTVTGTLGRTFEPTIEVGERDPADSAADVIYAGEGNDHVWGAGGNDILFGEGGDDVLIGESGDGLLSGNDILDGGTGADKLFGEAGNDILIGGKGDDIYIYNRGDGNDSILEATKGNTLRFGEGIGSGEITLRLGSLMLDLGNGDAVHIGGFDRNDVFNSSNVGSFEFADGTVRWRTCVAINNGKAANDETVSTWRVAA